MDRKYVLTGLGYAILGLILGIYMAASKNHGQLVTHAHIMLVGFVVPFIYGLCHRLWLDNNSPRLASIQFYIHQAGAAVLFTGLFLLYGNFIKPDKIDPVLGIASVTILVGAILMTVLFLQSSGSAQD